MIPTREEALFLMKEYNTEPFHIKHALTVEGVMRYFDTDGGKFWGIVGFLHDLDFEKYPEQHCGKVFEGEFRCKAKIRYRHSEQWATVLPTGADTIHITFDEPQRAITPGQAAVLYDGDIVLGGGTIK